MALLLVDESRGLVFVGRFFPKRSHSATLYTRSVTGWRPYRIVLMNPKSLLFLRFGGQIRFEDNMAYRDGGVFNAVGASISPPQDGGELIFQKFRGEVCANAFRETIMGMVQLSTPRTYNQFPLPFLYISWWMGSCSVWSSSCYRVGVIQPT